MGILKQKIATSFLIALAAMLLLGCAQISAPTGGPKDDKPPELLGASPRNESTNLLPTTLQLEFDEFIVLKNASNQLLISPPIATPPKLRVKGKSVWVEFAPESFAEEQTYVIAFGGGIVDLHESNPAKDLTWAFSTGDQLDTLQINGRVVDRMTGEGVKDLRVMLFRESIPWDSIMNGCRPDALGETNEEGMFFVGHLPEGKFHGLAISDADRNYQWSPGEYIAFESDGIDAKTGTFQEWLGMNTTAERGRPYIESAQIDSLGYMSIFASNPEDLEEEWSALLANQTAEVAWIREQDSVFCWMNERVTDLSPLDSLRIVWAIGASSDTSRVRFNSPIHASRIRKIDSSGKSEGLAQSSRFLRINRPIQIVNQNQLLLTQDSMPLEFEIITQEGEGPVRGIRLGVNEKDGMNYVFQALPGALESMDGVILIDTLMWEWSTHPTNHLGELTVDLSALPGPGWFCLSSKSNQENVARIYCQTDTLLKFARLLPGTYDIGFEWDENSDGTWQFSDPNGSIEPEPYFCAAKPAEIRSNWVFEWAWVLVNNPPDIHE